MARISPLDKEPTVPAKIEKIPASIETNLGFDPTTLSKRSDLVGRRILCLPKTFNIQAPSPVQLSSSLWSPKTASTLQASDITQTTTLSWCPIHHHHQDDQQNILHRIESIQMCNTTLEDSEQTTSTLRRARVARIPTSVNGVEIKNSSYSVMKKIQQQQKTSSSRGPNAAVIATRIDESNCDQLENSRQGPFNSCKSCDIEQITSNSNRSESFKQHLNSLPWRLGTIRAASHKNLEDDALDVMIEFDLVDWKTREWYNVRNRTYNEHDSCSNSPDLVPCDFKNKKKTSKDQEAEKKSKDQLTPSKIRERIVENDMSDGVQRNIKSSNLILSEKQSYFKLKPSAFRVLLIESSICCLIRQHSPIGGKKLWPALMFEPFIDEPGLFSSTNHNLKAIEYFDPTLDQNDNSIMKSICDIETIVTELEIEFSSLAESNQLDCNQKISFKTPNKQDIHPYQTYEKQKIDSSANLGNDDEFRSKINLECNCWSPKVEFRQELSIHRFCDQNLDKSESKFSTYRWSGEGSETAPSSIVGYHKSLPDTLQQKSGTINKDMVSITSRNLNSFKRFLRFFHYIHASIRSDSNATGNFGNLRAPTFQGQDCTTANDLLQAIIRYPEIYQNLKEWHLFQDSQIILGSICTASLLVSNRVKVYRCTGTTQWFTAVIIAYDERTNLLTLIDDTVLEEHHEDPTLLEIHSIDDVLIQSIIEGDVATNSGSTRRRTQRTNQRQAAQIAQKAIMYSSLLSNGYGGPSSGSTVNKLSCKSTLSQRSQICLSPSSSPCVTSSSQLATEIDCKTDLNSDTSSERKSSALRKLEPKNTTKSKRKHSLGHSDSYIADLESGLPVKKSSDRWINKLRFNLTDLIATKVKPIENREINCLGSKNKLFSLGKEFFERSPSKEQSNSPPTDNISNCSRSFRSGQSIQESEEGKIFTSHRLRLEALEKKSILGSSPYDLDEDEFIELEADLFSRKLLADSNDSSSDQVLVKQPLSRKEQSLSKLKAHEMLHKHAVKSA